MSCQEDTVSVVLPPCGRSWAVASDPPSPPVPAGTVVLTEGVTGAAHRVTREAFLAGCRAGNRYVALCGVRVLPLTLTAPARFHCPVCERST